MRTFEESLQRVLDPENYLWNMLGDEHDRERLVELRLDVPDNLTGIAIKLMTEDGWKLASRPDQGVERLERVFWRKNTTVRTNDKVVLLTAALQVAAKVNGTLVSWINVEELSDG